MRETERRGKRSQGELSNYDEDLISGKGERERRRTGWKCPRHSAILTKFDKAVNETKLLVRGVLCFSRMGLVQYPCSLSAIQRKHGINFRAQIINSPSSQRIERHILIIGTIRSQSYYYKMRLWRNMSGTRVIHWDISMLLHF